MNYNYSHDYSHLIFKNLNCTTFDHLYLIKNIFLSDESQISDIDVL